MFAMYETYETSAFSARRPKGARSSAMTAPPPCWATKVMMLEAAASANSGVFSRTKRSQTVRAWAKLSFSIAAVFALACDAALPAPRRLLGLAAPSRDEGPN